MGRDEHLEKQVLKYGSGTPRRFPDSGSSASGSQSSEEPLGGYDNPFLRKLALIYKDNKQKPGDASAKQIQDQIRRLRNSHFDER